MTQLTPPLVQAAPPTSPLRREPASDQAPLAPPAEFLIIDTVITDTVKTDSMTTDSVAAPAVTTVADQSLGVQLTLEVERPVLTPDTTVAVTLTVRAELAVTTDKAVLTLTLPKDTATTTGAKNKVQWNLPVMAAGELFQQQIQLQIDNANGAVKRDNWGVKRQHRYTGLPTR